MTPRLRLSKKARRERYPKDGSFVVDEDGNEAYAVDEAGNQLYPEWDGPLFARDRTGTPCYARDAKGDEYYPIRNGRSVLLTDGDGVRPALAADGTQRYPSDSRGNEYYPRHDREPFLLQRGTGETYLAKSREGRELIPWNHLRECAGDRPCVFARDAEGNTVYLKESEFPEVVKALIRCLCHISVVCPRMSRCTIRLS